MNLNWSDWLSNPVVSTDRQGSQAVTIVTGVVRDRAELFGLMSFVRDLGVPLIAVERLESSNDL